MAQCPLCSELISQVFCSRPTGEDYYECPSCGMIHLDSHFYMSAKEEKARYQLHENIPGDEGYLNFLKRLAEPLVEKLAPKSHGLDYGAGPGPVLAEYLTSQGYPTAVYDPFFHPEKKVLTEQYDFVTCTEAAEHFFNPFKEFEQLFGLLKPGGYLGIMTEFAYSDITPEVFLKWYYARDPSHVCFYKKETLEFIARRWGAKLEIPRSNVGIFQVS